jgi:hypothetical protein
VNIIKNLKEKITVMAGIMAITFLLGRNTVNANTGSIDAFIVFACEWLMKIGGVIALVGRSNVCTRLAT